MNRMFQALVKKGFIIIFGLLGVFLAACGGGGGGGGGVTAPAAPSNLVATTASSSSIDLAWTDASGNEDGFRVYRGATATTVTTLVDNVAAGTTSYQDTGLTPSTAYFYLVKAYNSAGESIASNTANAPTQPPPVTPPTAPSNLQAAAASSSIVNLTWTDASGNEEGFRLLRGTGTTPSSFTPVAELGANVMAYTDNTVSGSTTYVYQVLAWNSAGVSSVAQSAPITTPDVLKSVEGGNQHSLAVMEDGTVRAWGNNTDGALGVGCSFDNSLVPVQIPGLAGVSAVSAGDGHSLALLNNGRVKGWGQNFFGGVGSGDNLIKCTSVDVVGLDNVSAVSAGGFYSMALKNTGTVWAWGSGEFGQLGTGSFANQLVPVQIQSLSGMMTAISTGQNHTLALRNDGTVWAWGRNTDGQVGKGTFNDNQLTPTQVHGFNNIGFLDTVQAISAGEQHSIALMNDGTVRAWGYNFFGELGDGTTTRRSTPVIVLGLNNVVAISAGGFFSVALKNDGTVWAWGSGDRGQIGDGTTTSRTTPVLVSGLDNVQAISNAKDHTLAKRNGKSVWAWGSNVSGQIGDGTTIDRWTPVPSSGF